MLNIINQLKQHQAAYTEAEQRLIDYIINHPQATSQATIQELAQACHVSLATVSRFVKKIGLNSFRDLRLNLVVTNQVKQSDDFFGEIEDGDLEEAVINKVFSGAKNALTATLERNMITEFIRATDQLIQANRIGFFGIGGSSIVAFNAYHKFLRTPLDVISHPDYDIQLMQAVKLSNQDIAVVISHSGRNKDTLLIAKKLNEKQVPLIVITSFSNSPLAKLGDIVFISHADEVNYRSESMNSLIAQITIIDTLFTLVGSRLTKETQQVVDNMRATIEETRQAN